MANISDCIDSDDSEFYGFDRHDILNAEINHRDVHNAELNYRRVCFVPDSQQTETETEMNLDAFGDNSCDDSLQTEINLDDSADNILNDDYSGSEDCSGSEDYSPEQNEIDHLINHISNDGEISPLPGHADEMFEAQNVIDEAATENEPENNQNVFIQDHIGVQNGENLNEAEDDIGRATDVHNLEYQEGEADDLYDLINKQPNWSQDFLPIYVRPFTAPSGPNLPEGFNCATDELVDYFRLFWTDTLFETVARNTNSYFVHRLGIKRVLRPDFKDTEWYDTDPTEMKAFHGVLIYMGLLGQKSFKNYWSNSKFLGNAGIKSVFSLKRFCKLLENFHYSNRQEELRPGQPGYNKLQKMSFVVDHLNELFPKYFLPPKNFALDESIIPFSGRVSFLQFLKDKPTRKGVKVWVLSSETNYCHKFTIYEGKNSTTPGKNGSLFDVVDKLTTGIRGRNHTLFMDNLYSSVPLFKYLLTKQIYCTGTVRCQRKFLEPNIKNMRTLERGHHKMVQDADLSNLTFCVWSDTKLVRFLSTCSPPDLVSTTVRRIGGTRTQLPIPFVAKNYSKHYSSVDKLDFMICHKKYGRMGPSSKKFWRHLLVYCLNLAIANAYIIFKHANTNPKYKKLTQFGFREIIANQLIGTFTSRKRPPTAAGSGMNNVPENSGQHKLVRMPVRRGRRCSTHSKVKPDAKKHVDTRFGCPACNQFYCRLCFPIVHSK